MNELFLVAHKCNGEVALDIAFQIATPNDLIWCTHGGQSVHPYWSRPLADLFDISTLPDMPEEVNDYYEMRRPFKPAKRTAAPLNIEELEKLFEGL